MKRWMVAVAVLAAMACGGGETLVGPPVVSVQLTPSTGTLRALGATIQLTAVANDASGQPVVGQTVVWQSSRPSVATVTATGLVTAVSNGSATITATTDGVTGSAVLEVTQAASQLTFGVPPSTATAGQGIAPAVQVLILDAGGSLVASAGNTVAVAIALNPGGGTLAGTTTVGAVAGVATFNSLSINKAGTEYALVASSPTLTSAHSRGFSIVPAAAGQVVFTAQPSATDVTQPISPGVEVAIQDTLGNPVTSATNAVTLAIGTNPAGGTLAGTTIANASGGRAAFTDLSIDRPGVGYTLVATGSGLRAATSAAFNIRPKFSAVSAGEVHTCAASSSATAYCWGTLNGFFGTTPVWTPAAVSSGLTLTRVSAGSQSTCGITSTGAAYCWGHGQLGELGNGDTSSSTTPVPVSGGLSFDAVSTGDGHSCGVTSAGAAYCWGVNAAGLLGDGTATPRTSPVPVLGGLTFATVSAGGAFTCGVTRGGAAYCWGLNVDGELGDGGLEDSSTTPVPVSGGMTFTMVSSAEFHACGVTSTGAAYCWGRNDNGQLGDGSTTPSKIPVPVSGGLTVVSVSAGGPAGGSGQGHTCGVTTTGAAYCWGYNATGALGDGTATQRTSPVLVQSGLTFAAVSAGDGHTCGVTTAGAGYCWGANGLGQLGTGQGPSSWVPVRVVLENP